MANLTGIRLNILMNFFVYSLVNVKQTMCITQTIEATNTAEKS